MSLPKSTPRVFGSSCLFFLFLSFILLCDPAFAQPSGLAIQNYQLVSTTRAGRVLYDYTFKADIVNNGSTDVTGATATLINLVSTTTAIDDTLTFGNVPAGGTATSTDTFTIRVNRQYVFSQNDLVWNIILPVQDGPPIVTITTPVNLITVGSSPITVTGTVDDISSILTVNGVGVPINPDGTYSVNGIVLNEGGNTIVATAIDAANRVGTANIHVYLDSTPPYVTITYPVDGYTTTSPTITVTGSIVDIVKGEVNEANASVSVNGIPAPVSNKTFIAENLPLVEGPNIITAVGADQTGNTKTTSVTVNLDLSALKKINMVSGNNQSGPISTALPNPLIVSLTNNGVPVPNETVIFKVTQNNGTLTGSGPATSLAVTTDLNGKAQVNFALGSTAGVGNNKVEASAVGFTGEVVFTASGLISLPHKINISTGNNQKGAVSTPLPKPLIAIVTDEGHNPVNGVPVKFTVVKGGGKFDGQSSIFEMTDSDGRATATLTLGPLEGLDNNVVEANFIDSTGAAAIFSASGLAVGDPGDTRLSGVVLDNSNNPIPGVTMRVEGTTRQGVTDAQGQFLILNVPVGPLHLIVDGSTATVPGEFPLLSYEIDTVAGQNNTLPGPIYLLPLNTSNIQWVGGNEDVVYTLDSIPGFELVIKAKSVTFPNGSHEGYISVTQVHGDKVPMAPPNGQQPKFIITIQPPGAIFDPPAPITIPNVEALAPNEITNMYSFDHDLGQFVGIGTGTVSEDGLVVKSDPGVGIIKAGWHCGGNPQGAGCTHNCPECQKCIDPPCECRPDPSKKGPLPTAKVKAPSKVNALNEIGLGQFGQIFSLKNKEDKDCNNGSLVNDAVDDAKTDWNITGVDAKNVNNSATVTWNAKAEGNAPFNITIDDVGNPVDDPSTAGTPLTVKIVKPTGEITTGNGFGGTDAQFSSKLTPASVDYSGISVTERDGGTGADGCWFVGSAQTKFLTLTGGTWPVGAGNSWGDDHLSWAHADIVYYRANPAGSPRAPCSTSLDQKMDVVIPGGANVQYTAGRLIITIGTTTISATRNGVTLSKTYP